MKPVIIYLEEAAISSQLSSQAIRTSITPDYHKLRDNNNKIIEEAKQVENIKEHGLIEQVD